MTAMLEVRGLEVNYGHIEAVRGIDLDLNANEITALVGANGAGKSTTLLALSGLLPKARGRGRAWAPDLANGDSRRDAAQFLHLRAALRGAPHGRGR